MELRIQRHRLEAIRREKQAPGTGYKSDPLIAVDKELKLVICRIDESPCALCSEHGVNASCLKKHSFRKKVKNDIIEPHSGDYQRQKTFKCPMCTNKYYTDIDRREHILIRHLKEKPFRCEICEKSFMKPNLLRRHKEIHDPNYVNRTRNFECDQCDRRFDRVVGLKTHKRIHDIASKRFKCEQCLKSFYNAGDLETHVRTHTKEKPLTCSKCNRGFSHHSARINHQRLEHKFDCLKCTLSFIKILELKQHAQDHGDEVYCIFCDSMFLVKDINGHLLSHEDDLPYSCKVCNKRFQNRYKLNVHFKMHTTKFSCEICKKCLTTSHHLNKHKLIHDALRQKNFNCEVCEKYFAESWGLIAHTKKWHTEPHVFGCTGCDDTFQLESDANEHAKFENQQKSNAGDDTATVTPKHSVQVKYVAARPFKCGVCKFAFAANGDLQAHLETHSNRSKEFVCEFCKKAFLSAKMLKQHVATHLNKKSYRCSFPNCGLSFNTSSTFCGHIKKFHSTKQRKLASCRFCAKKFKTNSELLVHVNRHLNEKQFSCKVCEKRFHNNTELLEHMITHSDLRPYKCAYCDKTYQLRRSFNGHIKSHA